MAKKRTTKGAANPSADTEPPTAPDSGDDLAGALDSTPPPPPEDPPAPPAEPAKKPRGIQPGEQTIGAARFFGARARQDAIVGAFVTTDRTQHGNRKLTRKEWVKEYERFCSKPR